MLLIKINPRKPDVAALQEAAAVLKHGGLVVYPTETAYALGCDPSNARAISRIFSLKDRDYSKALAYIAASSAMIRRYGKFDALSRMLAEAFWPGPLTLTLPKTSVWHSHRGTYVPKTGEIAVRVSSHPVARALAGLLGRPIVSTSANHSGRTVCYDVPSVLRDLGAFPDLVLDAGPLKKTAPSTLVRAKNGVVEILRQGPISEDDVHRALMRRL